MTGLQDVLNRAQAAVALAAAPVADRTTGSVLIDLGTRMEKSWRGAYAFALAQYTGFVGLATRADVLRVREQVAALEYRVEARQGAGP